MTDRAQFEAMLEALINEDQEKAKEIFHNIVVGKSREIYEEILAEDFSISEEAEEEEEESAEEGANPFDSEEEEGEEEEGEEEEGEEEEGEEEEEDGEEDPFAGDDEEGGDEDLEDRVMDLEDALEDLKAEFEQLLAGEEGEDHMDDMGGDDMGDMGGDDMGDLDSELEADEEMMPMMEYKNMVKVPAAKMGDDGVNNTSALGAKSSPRNNMGGTTANMTKNFSTTSGGTKGGLAAPTPKDMNTGNINTVPGSAGKAFSTKVPAGHGAEKAGKRETADNKQSLLKQASRK